MKRIRYGLIMLSMLLCLVTSAAAQVSIGIGLPNVSIGINLPVFPHLVRVPGYPVYYAPQMDANYFFYDGMYWIYLDDDWYASTWYNGPWSYVEPESVPLYILRIPVRYYRLPPVYFSGWQSNAPPRWDQHWGHGWEQHRRGWNHWKRSSAPAPAPLPVYQRQYSGDRYPRVEQQQTLRSRSYRYQPRDTVVRQHFKQVKQRTPATAQQAPVPAQQRRQEAPPARTPRQQDIHRSAPQQQVAPPAVQQQQHQQVSPPPAVHQRPQHRGDDNINKSAPPQPPHQQREPAVREHKQQPGAAQHEQKQKKQDREDSQEPDRGRGQGQQQNDDERGRGRNK